MSPASLDSSAVHFQAMITTTKKIAKELAKALIALDYADWHARDNRVMHNQICDVRCKVSQLFTDTGYEFAENPLRVRIRRA